MNSTYAGTYAIHEWLGLLAYRPAAEPHLHPDRPMPDDTRPNDDACRQCRFFMAAESTLGTCHRYPPAFAGAQSRARITTRVFRSSAGWPGTASSGHGGFEAPQRSAEAGLFLRLPRKALMPLSKSGRAEQRAKSFWPLQQQLGVEVYRRLVEQALHLA